MITLFIIWPTIYQMTLLSNPYINYLIKNMNCNKTDEIFQDHFSSCRFKRSVLFISRFSFHKNSSIHRRR